MKLHITINTCFPKFLDTIRTSLLMSTYHHHNHHLTHFWVPVSSIIFLHLSRSNATIFQSFISRAIASLFIRTIHCSFGFPQSLWYPALITVPILLFALSWSLILIKCLAHLELTILIYFPIPGSLKVYTILVYIVLPKFYKYPLQYILIQRININLNFTHDN